MPERFELGDEALGGAFGVAALEVVAAEVSVELAGGEHVPAGADDRVLDGAERLLVAAAAASSSAQSSHLEPLRLRPERRLPADWSLPGHWPAQEASCSADGNQAAGSAPISETIAAEARTPNPGIDTIRSRWG